MNLIQYFFWLAGQAWSGPFYYWPPTAIITVGLISASLFNFPFVQCRYQRKHLLLFAPSGFSLIILMWGALMKNQEWAVFVVQGVFVMQLIVSIFVVCAMKGYRWFSIFLVSLQLWFGFWFSFVSAMSATGDWM